MKKITLCVLSALFAVYLLAGIAIYLGQRHIMYHPQPLSYDPPESTTLLMSDAGRIKISVIFQNKGKAILYFGGNSEDTSKNLRVMQNAFPDHSIFLMHYRGFGGSEGTPSERGLHDDALAIYKIAAASHRDISVIGRSLGSGVAIHLASERLVNKLVLVTPFNSLVDLVEEAYPIYPIRWMMKDTFDSWKYAINVKAPTLVLAAGQDNEIPMSSTSQLVENLSSKLVTLKILQDAGHNNIVKDKNYWLSIQQYLQDGSKTVSAQEVKAASGSEARASAVTRGTSSKS